SVMIVQPLGPSGLLHFMFRSNIL
ncbi:hypothetical protein Pmar_PMAR011925, partial [Perkinsus marinus ATCC 50983]